MRRGCIAHPVDWGRASPGAGEITRGAAGVCIAHPVDWGRASPAAGEITRGAAGVLFASGSGSCERGSVCNRNSQW